MSTPSSPKKTHFLQGRVFELIVCSIALIIAVVAMLQIPLTATSTSDHVTNVMFVIFAVQGVAAALVLRRGAIRTMQHKDNGNPFHRWFFFWLLLPAIFVIQLPWIFAGVFNADDVNTIGAIAMLLLLPWVMVGLGAIALMVFWAPFEMTVRALYKVIATRGKEGVAQLGSGLYFLLWVAIIIFGILGASTERVSYQAHNALLSALLGIPGDYTVKDGTFLWVTRILFVIAVILPFVVKRSDNDVSNLPAKKGK